MRTIPSMMMKTMNKTKQVALEVHAIVVSGVPLSRLRPPIAGDVSSERGASPHNLLAMVTPFSGSISSTSVCFDLSAGTHIYPSEVSRLTPPNGGGSLTSLPQSNLAEPQRKQSIPSRLLLRSVLANGEQVAVHLLPQGIYHLNTLGKITSVVLLALGALYLEKHPVSVVELAPQGVDTEGQDGNSFQA
jgi:hypothetical protein